MHILVVEDDGLQAESVVSGLKRAFPRAVVNLVETEHQFVTGIDQIKNDPPSVIVMDVMMRWTEPSTDMPPRPENVKRDGFYKAGFRCRDLLAQYKETKNIPLILYTVLENEDLYMGDPDSFGTATYLRKDAELDSLVHTIRECTQMW
jgi:DNA-binding NarL/FixJ family response regulator